MRYNLIPYKLRLKTLARILRRDDEALEQLELVKTRIQLLDKIYTNKIQKFQAIKYSKGVGRVACQAFTQRALMKKYNEDNEGALQDFTAAAKLGMLVFNVFLFIKIFQDRNLLKQKRQN